MTLTYCMASHCPLSEQCERFEDGAARHCIKRTYTDFSEELIRETDNKTGCPFFMEKAAQRREIRLCIDSMQSNQLAAPCPEHGGFHPVKAVIHV